MSKKLTHITNIETTGYSQVELDLGEIIEELKPEQLLALNKRIVEKLEELNLKPELSKYEIIEKNKRDNKSILKFLKQQ